MEKRRPAIPRILAAKIGSRNYFKLGKEAFFFLVNLLIFLHGESLPNHLRSKAGL
jgi:hypothetical protein